jgi:hypothetical protein
MQKANEGVHCNPSPIPKLALNLSSNFPKKVDVWNPIEIRRRNTEDKTRQPWHNQALAIIDLF